ncbi:hypothetical protein J421_5804 (plasmid) [Gemmatirosa kalamazoonensis]|jgi:hypothetical protein|uniref:Uncharacterized protein n=1 Tax=Gemmatirosa kalamazoonensis TaxID=861299 RepID=W0RQS8_9BACT|nr:hypothetical protein [Gemmatirosa kalamazoonensis]AHG93339.1 hypothetical protein J421_5804 [Gemmatirosa kalamazoonensis]
MRATLRASVIALRDRLARRPLVAAAAALLLIAAPAGAMADAYLFTSRAMPHDYNIHTIYASGGRVTVRGDGDTDLDCYLVKNGQVIATDDDATDYCILDTHGYAGPYALIVKNWGNVYNQYDVRIE